MTAPLTNVHAPLQPGVSTVTAFAPTEESAAAGSEYVAAPAVDADNDVAGFADTGTAQARQGFLGLDLGGATDWIGSTWDQATKGFSRFVHDKLPPQNPKIKDHQPDVAPAREAKPTAQQLRDAPLASSSGGADLAAAQRYADEAFARLDLSDPNRPIVLWVPGTDSHEMPQDVREPLERQFGTRATATHLDYPASVNFGPSSATGMEALRLLLAKIAEAGGSHEVMLAGHSQGAWVIGDAMQDPAVHAMVDRAVLYGNPGTARSDYTNRQDGKVIELNDPNDPVTWPVAERDAFLRGMDLWQRGDELGAAKELARTLGPTNFGVAMYYLARAADNAPWSESDPHHYEDQFGAGFEWLDTGRVR